MELIDNKRVTSRYSESIRSKNRSLYNQIPIELGKRVTSPKKKHKKKTSSPLKVIKINNTTPKKPATYRRGNSYNTHPPNTLPSNNHSDNYHKPKSRVLNHRNKPTNQNRSSKIPNHNTYTNYNSNSAVNSNNNMSPCDNRLPDYRIDNGYTHKTQKSPRNNSHGIQHPNQYITLENNPGYRYPNQYDQYNQYSHETIPKNQSHTKNINYQYMPELQNKYSPNTGRATPNRRHSSNKIPRNKKPYTMPRKPIKPLKPRKPIKLLKPKKPLYQNRRLYLNSKNTPKSPKLKLKEGKKYFNPGIFTKNKNQTEHFSKLSPEDIYICSILSEDLNIIKK